MLTNFAFNGQEVRIVLINNEPWWVAQDVCSILDILDSNSSLRDFDQEEKGMHSIHTLGGNQEMVVISESGLYRLIFKSRKAQAKIFQKWVFSEVLPQIRRTGKYEAPVQTQLPPHKEAVEVADSIRHITDNLSDNPRLAQVLIDFSISRIVEKMAIASGSINNPEPELRGVAEIAKDMGYPVGFNNRSQLGVFVKASMGHLAKHEKRLVNGVMRPVYCYPDTEEVREVIKAFFTR